MLRTILARAAAALRALAGAAAVAAPALSDYNHTSWSAVDGAPPQITTMAQTRDGWLWMGTADGLYRFDGVAFERITLPQRGMLGRALIYTLHALPNGDLMISHVRGGLSVLHADGSFAEIPDIPGKPMGPISAVDVDASGQIWVISSTGLYTRAQGSWRKVEDGGAWVAGDTHSLLRDRKGTLWATFNHRIWRYDAAGAHFVVAAPAGTRGSLMQSPDGRIWASRGDMVVLVSPSGPPPPERLRRDPRGNQAESQSVGQFDRDGNLWKIRCGVAGAACLLPARAIDKLVLDPAGAGEGLIPGRQIAGVNAEQVLEDREGNVWIATESSLDRYQRKRLQHSGLAGPGTPISLAADADGAVWAADATDGSLWRLEAGGPPIREKAHYTRVVGTARDGALLLSGRRQIERRLHGVVTVIPLPPGREGKPVDLNVLGTLDDGKVLWMASFETGLMGYVDGQWKPRGAFNLPPKIVISSAGATGQLWLADGDGGLTLYDDGKLTRYDAAKAGIATAVFAGSEVMVAGERGLAVLQNGAMRLLHAVEPGSAGQDVLRNISGMAVTPDGDRWFNSAAGLVQVRSADWQRALGDPRALLHYQLFDARDGYPGQATNANRLPSMVQAAGGELWLAASGGIMRLETRTLARNLVAPTVRIQQVGTVQGSYRASLAGGTPIRLPPASANFTVAYAAPALRRPENLHYAYWLEGVDSGWRDGGSARTASYTNVGPGTYRFHVRVANEDRVAGTGDAVQEIVVAPTVPQTWWFKALCVLAALLLGVGLYRYRIRVLTARLSERLQVRASERERIARTLHDTYLQSVNALMLRVSAMAHGLPDDHPTREKLEAVLADASHAVIEGRGQVEQLRTQAATLLGDGSDTQPDALERILTRSAAPLRQCYPDIAFAMHVSGAPRVLAPAVLDEAGQIGAEALRNAFIHAAATRIDVRIAHDAPFVLAVIDNGKGLDDTVRELGYRSGHWGLIGMRERARSIGAQLQVDSAAGTGTTVRLSVPDVYIGTPPRWRWFGRPPGRARGRTP